MLKRLKGYRTLVWSGFLAAVGMVYAVLQAVNVDMLGYILPEKYKPFAPLAITAIGVITGWLRLVTDTPLGKSE